MILDLSDREAAYLRNVLLYQMTTIRNSVVGAMPGTKDLLGDGARMCDELMTRLRVPVFYPERQIHQRDYSALRATKSEGTESAENGK